MSQLNSLAKMLSPIAIQEFGRIYGVKDQLERLKRKIESIQAVLDDAYKKQVQGNAVEQWIKRLQGVLDVADDLLDEIAFEDQRVTMDDHNLILKIVEEVCHFCSASNPILFRRNVALKIEKILLDYNDVVEDMSGLSSILKLEVHEQTENASREKGSYVNESGIIGRDDNKTEISNLLTQPHGNRNVSVIAIVGSGGVGKTTLAQWVYSDLESKRLFKEYMWICVSDNFGVKTIVSKILKSLTKGESNDQDSLANMQKRLRERLNGQKYLLVMDDIWNANRAIWDELINDYLMCGDKGSKILLTTRDKNEANEMRVTTLYDLKGLTTEQSWDLLKKKVFEKDTTRMNDNLESIGRKIAEKCRGVPLVIKAVAGILQGEYRESEWIDVLEADFWKHSELQKSIMPVLKLSYQNLSKELRQCFAYCSIYPKDWEIKKDELIQLWMAQGYLKCEKQHMEDVGNTFVKTLLSKSFFQDAVFNEYGDIFGFKMHDFMHDLALLVAGDDCYLDSEREVPVGRPMHVSLESSAVSSLASLDASRLRTLFLRQSKIDSSEPYSMLELFSGQRSIEWRELSIILSSKCLRVLNLSHSDLNKLPDSIDKLKHLRYLDLSDCSQLHSLPESIGNLVNLQTLKLRCCRKLEFSTKVLTKLINLRHLDIDECKAFDDMMPAGLEKLSSLQFLSSFVVGDAEDACKLNELKELNNLRDSLKIRGLHLVKDVTTESKEVNLKDKQLLCSLHLDWGDAGDARNYRSCDFQLLENLRPHQNLKHLRVNNYPGEMFSHWLSSLSNIVDICLTECRNCRYIPPLEDLSSLKYLFIVEMYELEYICYKGHSLTTRQFFPSLERLDIFRCEKLRGWERMGDDVSDSEYAHNLSLPSFPRLSQLTIIQCSMLTCMPTFPHLNEQLTLEYCATKPLIETLNMVSSSSFTVSSSSFTPLSMLKKLEIQNLDIKDLPNQWVQNLTSLQCLAIISCRDLESLPEAMSRLTNLQTLQIVECPRLHGRCQKETGADWPKIAHIPKIRLEEDAMWWYLYPLIKTIYPI